MVYVLGIEGSANKVAVGIVTDDGTVLSNPRKTCATTYPHALPLCRAIYPGPCTTLAAKMCARL